MTNANDTPLDVAAIAARVEAFRESTDWLFKAHQRYEALIAEHVAGNRSDDNYGKRLDEIDGYRNSYSEVFELLPDIKGLLDDAAALLAALEHAEAENTRLREALKGVDELAAEGLGEFSLSSAQRDFLDIRDVVSEVLHKRTADAGNAEAT